MAVLALLIGSCTSIPIDEDLSDHAGHIERLQRELLENPDSPSALRDLGAIYVRTGYPEQAESFLRKADSIDDTDPKTTFYLGLALERLQRTDEALDVYAGYVDMSGLSSYRRLMQGRYSWLVREAANDEIRQRLAEESEISDTDVMPDVVAVFPLTYLGSDETHDVIGRGLAEMMMIDLGQIDRIRVVERARLQALQNELQLAAGDRIDPATAPRLGRLLQAGRIVSGTYNVLPDAELRVDAATLQTLSSDVINLPAQSDQLNNFFRLEKQIVFALIDGLGLELSEAELLRIQRVPTQNLQAFIAYCRGLLHEDEQNFDAAAAAFQEAASIDPTFTIATDYGVTASSLGAVSGGSTEALESAMVLEPPTLDTSIDLVGSRMDQLGMGVGTTDVPGSDARNTTEETSAAGTSPAQLLPAAPPPPGNN